MNKRFPATRFTASVAGVGTGAVAVDFPFANMPIRGIVREVYITLLAGPATTVSFTVEEHAAGREILEYLTLSFPASTNDGVFYDRLNSATYLRMQVLTDDATNSSDLQLEVLVEGV